MPCYGANANSLHGNHTGKSASGRRHWSAETFLCEIRSYPNDSGEPRPDVLNQKPSTPSQSLATVKLAAALRDSSMVNFHSLPHERTTLHDPSEPYGLSNLDAVVGSLLQTTSGAAYAP